MATEEWMPVFRRIFSAGKEKLENGGGEYSPQFFPPGDLAFLESIGHRSREMFDFIDDLVQYGEPGEDTALLVASVRRDYFRIVQGGRRSPRIVEMDQLPPKTDEIAGLAWLPRIMAKARAKLRGEMPDDLMYGCGGDRDFLRKVNIDAAEFLHLVWAYDQDDERIIEYVSLRAGKNAPPGRNKF